MITRFKLETDGETARDCERQANIAVSEILQLEETTVADWEVTADVSWKDKDRYRYRCVLKRKTRQG